MRLLQLWGSGWCLEYRRTLLAPDSVRWDDTVRETTTPDPRGLAAALFAFKYHPHKFLQFQPLRVLLHTTGTKLCLLDGVSLSLHIAVLVAYRWGEMCWNLRDLRGCRASERNV